MAKIISEKTVFNDWFHVEEAEVIQRSARVSRMRLNRAEASGVLVYNTSSGRFILTKQFRYAISSKHAGNILEIVAGKVDPGETPEQAALRECEEEIGYRVQPGKLTHIASSFASPGYSSELLHLYYAEVSDSDKVSAGGGLEEEHEEIEIVEVSKADFITGAADMNDAKTLITALWFVQR